MIGLTRIDKKMYKGLLADSKRDMGENQKKYGAGFVLRFPGIVCAFAVHDFAEYTNHDYDTADTLYEAIRYEGWVEETFKNNEIEECMPKGALFDSMIYSMCQAETGDYGESEEDE